MYDKCKWRSSEFSISPSCLALSAQSKQRPAPHHSTLCCFRWKTNQSFEAKMWWEPPMKHAVFWGKGICHQYFSLVLSCGLLYTKTSFLDSAKINYENITTVGREKRWFEERGGKPLRLKQLETGNKCVWECVCFVYVSPCVCICDTAWPISSNRVLWFFILFKYTSRSTKWCILHWCCRKLRKLLVVICFYTVESSEKKLPRDLQGLQTASPMVAGIHCI